MKYIRTKDEIQALYIDDFTEEGKEYYTNCKIADTIEELCDEFVIDYKLVERHQFLGKIKLTEMAKVLLSGKRVYGAIWTDKGLIYVAKMNDKGELELL